MRLHRPATSVVVRGDRALIQQAVANLIDNALSHAASGSKIELSVDVRDRRPTLSVTDDGPGIPAEERDAVLCRFARLERSRTTEGHGLGLSLVAAIMALHDAELVLEDAKPGLRLRLSFPAG